MGPPSGYLALQPPSIFLGHNPYWFHSHMLWALLLLALELWAREPDVGLGPLASQGHRGCGACPFCVSPFNPPVSAWLLYILRNRTSVRLVFRWSSMMVFL